MVFDECHHAYAKHSYNQIMQSYMDQKLKNQSLRNTLPMVKYYIFSVFRLSYCHFAHPNQLLKLNSNTHSSLDHIKTEDKFSISDDTCILKCFIKFTGEKYRFQKSLKFPQNILDLIKLGGRRGCDRMVVGFTWPISAYYHQSCGFEPCSWQCTPYNIMR